MEEQLFGGMLIAIQSILGELKNQRFNQGYDLINLGNKFLIIIDLDQILFALLLEDAKNTEKIAYSLLKTFRKRFSEFESIFPDLRSTYFTGVKDIDSNSLKLITEDILHSVLGKEIIKPKISTSGLNHPLKKIQKRAIWQISNKDTSYSSIVLINRFQKEKDLIVKMWIIRCLAKIGGNNTIEFLKKNSQCDNELLRCSSLIALKELGENEFVNQSNIDDELLNYVRKEFYMEKLAVLIKSKFELWWYRWSGEVMGGIVGAIVGAIIGFLLGFTV